MLISDDCENCDIWGLRDCSQCNDFDKNRGGATVILHDQWNSTYEVEIKELMIDTEAIELKGRWVKHA